MTTLWQQTSCYNWAAIAGSLLQVGGRVVVLSKSSCAQTAQERVQVPPATSQPIQVTVTANAAQGHSHGPKKNQRSKGQGQTSRQHKRPPPETSESSSQEESSSDTEDFSRGQGCLTSPEGQSGPGTSLGPQGKHTLGARSGMPSVRPNAMKNRQRQLETLRRYEEKFRQLSSPTKSAEEPGSSGQLVDSVQRANNPMVVHVLDITEAVTEKRATWLPFLKQEVDRAPEDRILYSLTKGRAELILFGGLQTDVSTMSIQSSVKLCAPLVSSQVLFLRAPRRLS